MPKRSSAGDVTRHALGPAGVTVTAEPTRTEVLAWLERTGRTVAEAVSEFWPTADEAERGRLASRVKQWRHRARRAPPAAVGPDLRLVRRDDLPSMPAAGQDDDPPPDLSTMSASEQARWQLSELTRLHRRAGARNDARSVVLLCARLSAVRGELEEARKREGIGAAPLDPHPAAVALDLVKADKQIAELAELMEMLKRQQKVEG